MMRPPPPPIRRSEPSTLPRKPQHPSFPNPPQRPPTGLYQPSPARPPPSAYPQLGMPQTSHYRPPSAAQGPQSEEEESREYESYQSSMPEAQPMHQPSFSQMYGPASQTQTPSLLQPNNVLVPESSNIPRRAPRPPAQIDLLGDFSPPSSIPLPPARQQHQSETVIPETRTETQSQSQSQSQSQEEGASAIPPRRVDTYRPEARPARVESRRPTNVWQMGLDGGMPAIPGRRSASVMGRPATSMGGLEREGRSFSRAGGTGAAELFMASTQQQGGGGAKTNSEKIMDALSDWASQILNVTGDLRKDQKQVRDQVHAVQTGQNALATREEVVEEITSQLSPALHEFFQTLHEKVEKLVKPLPEDMAKLAAEKMRGIMMETKQIEASQRSQESNQEKPLFKLLDHLISKLDAVSHISTFLHECKDLPETLRDVIIYKQSMDAVAAIANNAPPPAAPAPVHPPQPQIDLRAFHEGFNHLSAQMHNLLTRPSCDSGSDERILHAITTLAQGLDRIAVQNQAPPPAPPPPPPYPIPEMPQPPIEPPELSNKVDHLSETVNTLSSDMRDIKALLAGLQPQQPQPMLDIAEIVTQLKAALPLLAAQPAPPPVPSNPHQQSAHYMHPPLLPSYTGTCLPQLAEEDYSQLQPTEVGNSQSQTVCDYPTPVSALRGGRSSTISGVLTQPSSDFGEPPTSVDIAETSSATAPNPTLLLRPAPQIPSSLPTTSPSGRRVKIPAQIIKGVLQEETTDVFGAVQSTSDIPLTLPVPSSLGTGTLEVSEVMDEEAEDVDGFDDIFDQPRKEPSSSRVTGPFKRPGKRSASNAGSTSSTPGPSKKRTRTRTTTTLPSVAVTPKPKSTKAKIPTSSASATTPKVEPLFQISEDSSPETPIAPPVGGNPASATIDTSLLDPSSFPGGGILKRSPRLVAVRTNSTDPMYNSDLSMSAASAAQRKRSTQSRTVKQERIDAATQNAASGAGSSGAQPITIIDSDSLESPLDLRDSRTSPTRNEDSNSLNSLSLSPAKSRAGLRSAKASGSGAGGVARADMSRGGEEDKQMGRRDKGKGKEVEEEPEQSLYGRPKDPAPLLGATRYKRNKRAGDLSWGDDDIDEENGL